jgi:hypothetical protein
VLSPPTFVRYVRSGAAGSGDGSDWTNACSDFTGACAPSSLTRGFTYYVAGGSYGSGGGVNFSAPVSGTQSITVRAATVTDHGASTGWQETFAASGSNQAVFTGVFQVTTDNWNFDGQTTGGSYPSQSAANLIFSNPTDGNNFSLAIGSCSGSTGASNTSFRYIEFKGTNTVGAGYSDNALQICNGSNNVYVGYSYLHGAGDDLVLTEISSGGSWANGHTFEYNWFSMNKQGTSGGGSEAIDMTASNVVIRFNVFQDIKSNAIIDDAAVTNPVLSNWDFYGNVVFWDDTFAHSSAANLSDGVIGFFGETFSGNLNIYNNTIAEINNFGGSGIASGRPFMAMSAPGGSVNIYNNLIWNSINVDTSNSSYNMDYNSYYGGTGDTSDTSPHKQVSSGNPFVNSTAYTFTLSGPTAAGLTLPAPYNVDMTGKTRGQDGVWDRGAFEY